jgi:hypothetical protein
MLTSDKMVKDIFEEATARREIARARERVELLKRASAAGEQVNEQLRQAEAELAAMRQRFSHGDVLGFCVLCVFFALSALAVRFFASSTTLVEFWGTPDHAYLHRFRYEAALTWRICQVLASSPAPLVGLLAALGLVWAIQSRMRRWSARWLLQTLIALDLFFLLALTIAFSRLLSMPLG